MPTPMHELASAPPTNNLIQQVRYAYTPATAPPQSPILMLTMLMLLPRPHDMPPMLPLHVFLHASLFFGTPSMPS
ncbi:hypothetical protein O181_094524 [Austropuccinia psidii MF-1]|uniref:Uncharacterized protein n=1 Tax=Austropuccinia psidii MF-1 TaxID=1389203 RepID=A0A9Q3PAW7_9BASI|nr:hypothetical protein [Austropuccinia psidii MF-1]